MHIARQNTDSQMATMAPRHGSWTGTILTSHRSKAYQYAASSRPTPSHVIPARAGKRVNHWCRYAAIPTMNIPRSRGTSAKATRK